MALSLADLIGDQIHTLWRDGTPFISLLEQARRIRFPRTGGSAASRGGAEGHISLRFRRRERNEPLVLFSFGKELSVVRDDCFQFCNPALEDARELVNNDTVKWVRKRLDKTILSPNHRCRDPVFA